MKPLTWLGCLPLLGYELLGVKKKWVGGGAHVFCFIVVLGTEPQVLGIPGIQALVHLLLSLVLMLVNTTY